MYFFFFTKCSPQFKLYVLIKENYCSYEFLKFLKNEFNKYTKWCITFLNIIAENSKCYQSYQSTILVLIKHVKCLLYL